MLALPLVLLFLFVSGPAPAAERTLELNRKLEGQVVVVELYDYLLYTDVPRLMVVLSQKMGVMDSDSILMARIRQKQRQRSADTIRLACWELLGWDRDSDNPEERAWNTLETATTLYPGSFIIVLAEAGGLQIYDKRNGKMLRAIIATDSGSHATSDLRVSYCDPENGNEIFGAVHYLSIGNPKF